MTSLQLRAALIAARMLLAGSVCCAARPAWGQVPISTSAPDPTVQPSSQAAIVLMFDPTQDDSLSLVDSVAAHLSGLPVRVIREARPRTELLTWLEAERTRVKAVRALGLFAVDVSRRQGWRLFFFEADGAPTLIRRLKPGPERASLDEAGITVRLLVEALLDGKHIEVTEPVLREEPTEDREASTPRARTQPGQREHSKQSGPGRPRSSTPPARSAEGTPAAAPAAGAAEATRKGSQEEHARRAYPAALLGLSASPWLSGQGWQSGVLTGAALHLNPGWSVSIEYLWFRNARYQSPDATITLSRHPVATRVTYRPSSGFSPVFNLGTWLDVTSRQTLQASADYRSTGSTTEVSWGFNAGLGVSSPRLSILSVRLDLGLEVAARGVSYVVQSETTRTILQTSSARPILGVVLDLGP